MSSSLNSFVPVLEGHNYQSWAPAMTSYLMHAGQLRVFKKDSPVRKLCNKYYMKEVDLRRIRRTKTQSKSQPLRILKTSSNLKRKRKSTIGKR
jgi:hypothetical protein